MTQVYLVAGVRSAVGAFGGALRDVRASELATQVAAEAIRRSGAAPAEIGAVVVGQVVHTEPHDPYLPRIAAIGAGVPVETPAMAVNRLCGSGLQAIVSAAQSLLLGDAQLALAGGVEMMSRIPYAVPAARFGARMGDGALQDPMVGALTDPFGRMHMGVTAENVARRHEISRTMQDDAAFESHRRASAASRGGLFRDQILPIEVKAGRKTVPFEADEHIRHDARREDFDALRPVFQKADGTVTAGNASGLNDAAAMVVLASEAAVRRHGLTPMARLVSYGHAGVEPEYMGLGPVPASRLALQRAGLGVADLGVIESNEAFAAQACAVTRLLELDPARVNPNGSGISLGHPIGATGAITTVKLVHEMRRAGHRYGLVTMCIGGGQGIAAIFERV